ncbi:UDP-N-acetylglucosamine 2-epimerase (non-hydrolyzing) [uncultured Cytophaga sp.]|uniref:non-hydrolyzing UDP-N-acetylglucosamine 2-epimerase n=1 Tax=uncultured Cytophaga sp. TaxID=160238 RepID=UPI00260E6FCF|nr:UDP-N-acetylglucosamine 2-epimerase (non-hydrolyzing) [uncultured Cytophaga sp.]
MLELVIVAGARPNFVKIAPLIHKLLSEDKINYTLVHTGQHYDPLMNDVFFEDLAIPKPSYHLGITGGSQNQQTSEIILRFEEFLKDHPAKAVVVVGDVNSTMACSIVAKKLHKDLIHIEAGLRSYDRNMPEEINRLLTDSISDYFFTTSLEANQNLLREGVDSNRIQFVGNIMIDTLVSKLPYSQKPDIYRTYGLESGNYYLLTLHRTDNVDNADALLDILRTVSASIGDRRCVFPVHPRTEKMLRGTTVSTEIKNIEFIEPLRYLEFLYLQKNAKAVMTDSGGIQEETTFLKVPCITYRTTTERPETIHTGSNELATNLEQLAHYISILENGTWKDSQIPELWDGKTAERILQCLYNMYSI